MCCHAGHGGIASILMGCIGKRGLKASSIWLYLTAGIISNNERQKCTSTAKLPYSFFHYIATSFSTPIDFSEQHVRMNLAIPYPVVYARDTTTYLNIPFQGKDAEAIQEACEKLMKPCQRLTDLG